MNYMSRIGKQPVTISAGVELGVKDRVVSVKGPKGALTFALHPHATVVIEGGTATVSVKNPEDKKDNALWGTTRQLIENMIQGVTIGFTKKLEAIGVGYKAAAAGPKLTLEVGFSHPVVVNMPAGISVAVEKNTISISGIDKQMVGEVAAQIRRIRKPEPYKGKGIKYIDEVIRRKAGKAAKTGAAAK